MKQFVIALALAASCSLHAQQTEGNARPNEVVFRSGPWYVVRSVRDFGNVVACTGFYKLHPGVQLAKDNMIVKTNAQVQSIAVAYDDKPAAAPRQPTAVEKEMHAIVFAGKDFEDLKRSRKLNLALVTDKAQGDHTFDLKGMLEALANIDEGCPVPTAPLAADAPAQGRGNLRETLRAGQAQQGGREGGVTCGPRMIARMRNAGVTDEQMQKICQQ